MLTFLRILAKAFGAFFALTLVAVIITKPWGPSKRMGSPTT